MSNQKHNIVPPCSAKSMGDAQWIVVDGDGNFVCNTLHGNDEANAKFIAEALNKVIADY